MYHILAATVAVKPAAAPNTFRPMKTGPFLERFQALLDSMSTPPMDIADGSSPSIQR
jgi:hypothetical protein